MSDETDDQTILNGHDVEAELLADWRLLFTRLHARFETGSFETGAALVAEIAALADAANHHPDVDLTYPRVDVRLSSHDVGGVTQRDVRLAREISDAAGRLGATARPGEVSVVELGLDTWDFDEVKPFWAALLGYEGNAQHDGELNDPDGTMPSIWAQETERHDTPRQRWHLDLRVPPETAEARIAKALEAGGTLVSDERAPAFWVLSDAQGNLACITTWLGRTEKPADQDAT
ncbi:4a-hydroxytetrahydrobiopterin dehydratase [Nocardioides sp. C4-1]|uniref:4a-hydroxytetrahydrobiopterin dehydratase n=1 Tax=Nocardioides sp. C4-1 TaxID=3151851 RepID=UPI003267C140